MMKKLLALALVCVLCVGLLPSAAFAGEPKWVGGDPNCKHENFTGKNVPVDDETHQYTLTCGDCGAKGTLPFDEPQPHNKKTSEITPGSTGFPNGGTIEYCEDCGWNVEKPNSAETSTECTHPKDKLLRQSCVPKDSSTHTITYICGVCEKEVTEEEAHDIQTFPASKGDPNFAEGTMVDYCGKCNYMAAHQGSSTECTHPERVCVSDGEYGHHWVCSVCHADMSEGQILRHDLETVTVSNNDGTATKFEQCPTCLYVKELGTYKDLDQARGWSGYDPSSDEVENGVPKERLANIHLSGLKAGVDYTQTITSATMKGEKYWIVTAEPIEGVSVGKTRSISVKAEKDACDHPNDQLERFYDGNKHWYECGVCGQVLYEENHITVTQYDETQHWSACTVCPWVSEKTDHIALYAYDETDHWGYCVACNWTSEKEKHTMVDQPVVNGVLHSECECGYITDTKVAELDKATVTGLKGDGAEYTESEAKQIGFSGLTEGVDYTKSVSSRQNADGSKSWVIVMEPVKGKAVGSRTVTVNAACEHPSFTYVIAGMQGHYKECTACKEQISEIEAHDMEEGQVTIIMGYFTRIDRCRQCPFTEAIQMNKAPDLSTAEVTGVVEGKAYTQSEAKQIGLEGLTEGVDYTKTVSVRQNGDGTKSWVIVMDPVENKAVGSRTVTVNAACEHPSFTYVIAGMQGHYKECTACKEQISEIEAHDMEEGQVTIIMGYFTRIDRCRQCPFTEAIQMNKAPDLSTAEVTGVVEGKAYTQSEAKQIGLEGLTEGVDYTKTVSVQQNGDETESWVIKFQPVENKAVGERTVTVKKVKACEHKHTTMVNLGARGHFKRCDDCGMEWAEQPHQLTTECRTVEGATQEWRVCDVCPYRTLVIGGRLVDLLEAVAEGLDENAEYTEEDLSQIGLEDLTEGEDYTKSYVSVENGDGAESWVVRLQPIEGKSTGEWVVTLKKKACPHENRVWSTNEQFHWERCLDCDHLTAPEAHVFEPKVVTPATCTQNAVLRMECKCGMVDPNGRTAPEKGDPAEWFAHHVWGPAYSYDSLAHWQICSVCQAKSEDQKHTVANLTVDREPTCLKDGFVSYDCPVCQARIKTVADEYEIARYPALAAYGALGHDFSGPLKVCTGPNVCTSESQGTHAASCVRCGTTDLEHRSAHAWTGLHNVQNGTCNDPNDPVIQEASCECGAALHIEKIREHVPVEDKSQDVQATCTESGKINGHRCVICGTFYDYEFVEALGHDWVEDEKVEATCLADGFIKSHCARCNEEKTEILKMKSPDGKHHFVPQYSKQPTCTEKGTANGEKCKYCDAEQAGETGYGEIPALGHKKKAEATKKGRVKEYITSNGVIEVTCYEVMFLCERCSHALGVEYYTVGTNPKISKYLIEPGKDVKITDLGNGIHIDGNMANDGGAYFNGEVKKAFNEVLDLAAEKYTYKKVPANSFIIEFTDEFLSEQEDGDYTLEIINGSEYWPLVVTIKDHKFTDVQPMDVPQDVPEWSMADYEAWVNQIRDAGAQLKELTVGCPEREK